MRLDDLNALEAAAAARELRRCCGSSRWAERMAAARPFAGADAILAVADRVWWSLDAADWLEAFAAHPTIGSDRSREAGRSDGPDRDWAAEEQAGVADAGLDLRERLAQRNREYQARFGYIFIVCATGRSAAEMLGLLEARLTHDPEMELRIAADEQRKITRLRLEKLLAAAQDTPTS